MTPDLDQLRAKGVLSPLDYRFAQALGRLSGEKRPEVLVAAAMTSLWMNEGHVCLDLDRLKGPPELLDEDDRPIDLSGWPPTERWLEQLRSSPLVGNGSGVEPLVLDSAGRLYLRRLWQYEQELAGAIAARAGQTEEGLDEGALATGLKLLFPGSDRDSKGAPDLPAFAAATAARRKLCVITGGPGTGKTSTVIKILVLLLEQAQCLKRPVPRMTLLAPTGKAASRLAAVLKSAKDALGCSDLIKKQIPERAYTIHRILGASARGPADSRYRGPAIDTDLVLVDEASMVDLEMMARLFAALPASARVILLGDKDQLASVEAGAVLSDICSAAWEPAGQPNNQALSQCIVQLSRTYRYAPDSGIGLLAEAVKAGDASGALALLVSGRYPDIGLVEPSQDAPLDAALSTAVIEGYTPYVRAETVEAKLTALDRFRVLCAHRRGRLGAEKVNAWIAAKLKRAGLLDADKGMFEGRPLLVTRNDYRLELYNGDVGLVLAATDRPDQSSAYFIAPDGGCRSFSLWELPPCETALAMSVHKSQGSEFDRVAVLLPDKISPVLSRELLYTAVTRARHSVTIYSTAEVVEQTIVRPLLRSSGLSDAILKK